MSVVAKPEVRRPDRWDKPFGPRMSDEDIARILAIPPLSTMDPNLFPASAPLREIVRNDMRIMRYDRGDIIIRAGDHGTSAYAILTGSLAVILPPGLPARQLGRAEPHRKSFLEALSQLWNRPSAPEVRHPSSYQSNEEYSAFLEEIGGPRTKLDGLDDILNDDVVIVRDTGTIIGEIAALTRTPRQNTIVAAEPCELIEIRRPGVLELRRRDPAFKAHVDKLYRERTLKNHLLQSPIFVHLAPADLDSLAAKTLFETFGSFDWQQSFIRSTGGTPAERLAKEPVIARERDYPDGLLMVRSGFARVSTEVDQGHRTLEYIGSGALFGLEEIYHNWKTGGSVSLQRSLRAVGYCDILRVPTHIVEKFVLPSLSDEERAKLDRRTQKLCGAMGCDEGPGQVGALDYILQETEPGASEIPVDVLEFLVDNRFINGTQTMLIDMDRCVRCDACVNACAVGHNNNPRFNRHGLRVQNYMVANACMHCVDPVCMIGCPTGAISRTEGTGQVVVNDETCIGCATCAENCPYNNIRMVDIRDEDGRFVRDQITGKPLMKSTKCDLCADQMGGPACQRACPHDALTRMNLSDTKSLAGWLNR